MHNFDQTIFKTQFRQFFKDFENFENFPSKQPQKLLLLHFKKDFFTECGFMGQKADFVLWDPSPWVRTKGAQNKLMLGGSPQDFGIDGGTAPPSKI